MNIIRKICLKNRFSQSLIFFPIFLIIFLIILNAWFCDDAFFTLRPALNFHYGLGPVWNPGERVQSFTNPLWMFILSLSNAKNILNFTILISIFLVIGQLYLLINFSKNIFIILLLFLLSSSWTYIYFGTSGLETPLSGFLVALSYFLSKKSDINSKLRSISLLTVLSYLSRPDLLIINFLDPFFRILFNKNLELNRRINRIFKFTRNIFFIMLIWFMFSILYFGFPFPVTAYSKLLISINRLEIITKGIGFFISFLITDLSAVIIILTAFILPLFIFLRNFNKFINLSYLRVPIIIFLNILYTIYIGGDFILGRFYYPLLIYSTFSLADYLSIHKETPFFKRSYILFCSIIILISPLYNGKISKVWPISSVSNDLNYPLTPYYHFSDVTKLKTNAFCTLGACDEQAVYSENGFAFFRNEKLNSTLKKLSQEYENKPKLQSGNNIFFGNGFSGFSNGPRTINYDDQGLTDLLQARMPYIKGTSWRAAHFTRFYPRKNGLGYLLKNDKEFMDIFNSLNQISKGRIFSMARFNEIVKQNFGIYNSKYKIINQRYGTLNLKNCLLSNRKESCIVKSKNN